MQVTSFKGAEHAAPQAPTAAAPVSLQNPTTTVMFGKKKDSTPEKSQRTGLGGFFDLLGRIWNRLTLQGHQREDNKMRENPIPHLTEERNQLVEEFNTVERELAGIIADRDLAVADLEELVKTETKEKAEAAAAREVQKGMSEDDADFQAQSDYTALQAREWTEAKARREEKETEIERLNVSAEEAKLRIEEYKDRVQEMAEKLEEAERLHKQNLADERFIAMTNKLETIAGRRVGYSDETAELINDIKKRNATNQVLINGGRSTEERLAELRAKQRSKEVEVQSALDELDAALAEDDAKKGEGK